MSNEYIDKLIEELESQGIKRPEGTASKTVPIIDDRETQIINNMQRITGKQYSDEQRKILEHHGNACILACAGSGKTTISTHLIAKRIQNNEIKDISKLIYTTYSNAGANEMKERLDSLLKQLNINVNVQVRTIHSFFLQVIRTFGVSSKIIENNERSKMIRQACRDASYTPKDDELMLIDNLLSYQVNNLLSDKKTIECYVNTIEDLTVEQYSAIRTSYAKQKADKGLIDFDDMQSLLYLWMVKMAKSSNQAEVDTAMAVINYCKAMYTDFYIDEAQDVSKIQYAIIRAIVEDINRPGRLDKNLVFIGDDDQCIYQWRGSDPSIILSIGATFDMPTFVLSTNYRCLNEIVDYATTGIKCNNSRYNKGMQAFENGGSVKILQSSKTDLCNLSIYAMNHIKWWIQEGARLKDIAVLSRNNFHCAILSNMLLREGIYCNITEDMKLTKSYMYKDIKMLIELSETTWKPELTSSILWKLCRYLGMGTAKMIAEFQDMSNISLEDALGYIVKSYINKDIDFKKTFTVSLQADEKIKYYVMKMSSETKEDIQTVYNCLKCKPRENGIRALLYQYLVASSFMYKSKDKNRSIKGLVTYIEQLFIKDGLEKTLEFLRVTEQLEQGKMVIPGEKITLTTIHSAKGREWKNVIMFACDNISEPSFDGLQGMMDDGINIHDIYENIDEERRLFYVGNTRAKENLLVITYNEPSIFIIEALGAFKDNKGGNNDTIMQLIQGKQICVEYKDIIDKYIVNNDSKYHYNADEYKLRSTNVKE